MCPHKEVPDQRSPHRTCIRHVHTGCVWCITMNSSDCSVTLSRLKPKGPERTRYYVFTYPAIKTEWSVDFSSLESSKDPWTLLHLILSEARSAGGTEVTDLHTADTHPSICSHPLQCADPLSRQQEKAVAGCSPCTTVRVFRMCHFSLNLVSVAVCDTVCKTTSDSPFMFPPATHHHSKVTEVTGTLESQDCMRIGFVHTDQCAHTKCAWPLH